jgi:anaerobic ribonucleoside-triphosphate reductase activating protein
MDGDVLMVADRHPACRVLGPGTRYALWVQGCPLSCRGCVSPQWIPFAGGSPVPVDDLAREITATADDGLTVSGGEPFAQAAALVRLVSRIRASRDLSIMAYTGYTLGFLARHGDPAQRRLLQLLDLLVDGPYVAARHSDLRWRGSDNQRIRQLSGRHQADLAGADRSAGLQFEITTDAAVHWMGVPPVPGFRGDLERALGLRQHACSEEPTP